MGQRDLRRGREWSEHECQGAMQAGAQQILWHVVQRGAAAHVWHWPGQWVPLLPTAAAPATRLADKVLCDRHTLVQVQDDVPPVALQVHGQAGQGSTISLDTCGGGAPQQPAGTQYGLLPLRRLKTALPPCAQPLTGALALAFPFPSTCSLLSLFSPRLFPSPAQT